MLRAVPGFERVSLFVLHHHEAFDGKGYPAGLRGDEIPIGSRIVSVMDSFDPIVTSKFIAMARAGATTVFDATGASLASAL